MSGWSLIPLQRSLGPHAAAWDALNERRFGNQPLLTSLFVECLLRHFGDGTEHLCVLEQEGVVQAMCVLHKRGAMVWRSFLPSQAQIAPTLIADPDCVPSLRRCLPGWVAQVDLLCNDPLVGGVLKYASPSTQLMNHALTMQIALTGTFESYWTGRSKNLQSNFKRYEKRLQADGLVQRFVQVTSPEQMLSAVDRYAELEGSGWKGGEGTALGSTPAQLQFYQDLMLGASHTGDAIVHELWLNDRLAASRLVLRRNAALVILKTTYDETLATYAPGRVQLRALIEDAFLTIPNGMLEFYTDANQDQLSWSTGERRIQHSTIYRSSWAKWLVAGMRLKRVIDADHSPNSLVASSNIQVDSYQDIDGLPEDAKKLMAKAEQRNAELGLDWYRNLVKTVYPTDTGIRFYVLRKGDQTVAVVPLRAKQLKRGWELESLSNFYTALYEPAMATNLKSQDLTALMPALRRDFPGVGAFRLSPMDPESHAYQTLLGAFRLRGWFPFEFFAFGNWYMPVQDTWEDYLADRDGTLRSTLKRMRKKFLGDGGTLQLVTASADMPAAIAAYEKVYAESWKRPEPFLEFSPGLINMCASKGWLRLGIAWLNDQPIAAQLWIVGNGRAEIYKLAYSEAYKSYSSGTLLTSMLMQHVIEVDKAQEVDYLIGDDPYKKTWVSHRRERWGIVAYTPRSFAGVVALAREALGRGAKPWVSRWRARFKKSPTQGRFN